MVFNYVKIAIRNILRNKTNSIINIVGLAVGMACVILIGLFLNYEWSYDAFHANKDRIYRMVRSIEYVDMGIFYGTGYSSIPLGPTMQQEFPEVVDFVRTSSLEYIVQHGENSFYESVTFADPSLFTMFSFPLIAGNPTTALSDLHNIVITEEMAEKYFGAEDPMGKNLLIEMSDQPEAFVITGVAQNIPSQSTIQFGLVTRFENVGDWNFESWGNAPIQTYVMLEDASNEATLTGKFPPFVADHYGPEIEQRLMMYQMLGIESSMSEQPYALHLQPLREIYLHFPWASPIASTANPTYSFILAGITILILLLACINFTTLALAQSTTRTQEVGVRKVVGARRLELISQFWGESLVMVALASMLALILAGLFLPIFNDFTQRSLTLFTQVGFIWVVLFVLGLIVVAIIAGGYPALVLSRLQPVQSLQGQAAVNRKNRLIQVLNTLQYALAILFICCTLLMTRQVHFMLNYDVGIEPEKTVVLPIRGNIVFGTTSVEEVNMLQDRLKSDLMEIPGITYVSPPTVSPATVSGAITGYTPPDGGSPLFYHQRMVDPEFLDIAGLELIEGQFFDETMPFPNLESIVVNETFIREFGIQEPVIGQTIPDLLRRGSDVTIIGVVKDIPLYSLHREIDPAVYHMNPALILISSSHILVQITPEHRTDILAAMETVWDKHYQGTPFEYTFLDDDYRNLYADESRWGRIMASAAIFAVFIACLGLFGLVSLAAARRTKEIGIRKVVGASVGQVVALLSKEFLILVLIANVIAWPIAWYAMRRWLENFAYRIDLGPGVFILAGLLALVIALVTVSWQTVRAASANPVEALRYE